MCHSDQIKKKITMSVKFRGILLIAVLASCECSKILFVHPSSGISHVKPLQILAVEMAKRGHEVTFVSMYPFDKPVKNYRDIKIEISEEQSNFYAEISRAMTAGDNIFKMLPRLDKAVYFYGNKILQSAPIKNLMIIGKFDLLVAGYFMNGYILGLADHFKCPSIIFFSGSHTPSLNTMVGNPISPEGTTHGHMSTKSIIGFLPRLQNMLIYASDYILFKGFFYYRSKSVYK